MSSRLCRLRQSWRAARGYIARDPGCIYRSCARLSIGQKYPEPRISRRGKRSYIVPDAGLNFRFKFCQTLLVDFLDFYPCRRNPTLLGETIFRFVKIKRKKSFEKGMINFSFSSLQWLRVSRSFVWIRARWSESETGHDVLCLKVSSRRDVWHERAHLDTPR